MNPLKSAALLGALLMCLPAAAAPKGAPPPADPTLDDIKATLGFVPEFFKAFPSNALPGAWNEMKNLQMNTHTAIPAKYKELIGLAVSAQVPCHYCVYFHTQTAKLNGATDAEIGHALAEASLTRHWSTFLNGMNQDESAFRAEVTRMVEGARTSMAKAPPASPPPAATTAKDAYAEMQSSFGFIPTFLKTFPEEGIVGAWNEWKAVEMTPGALPEKMVSLTSIAVAAQIPCRYCVIADTEFATKLNGANEREVREAIAMASLVRHWSTFLNGAQVDEKRFRKDVDTMVANAKKAAPKSTQR